VRSPNEARPTVSQRRENLKPIEHAPAPAPQPRPTAKSQPKLPSLLNALKRDVAKDSNATTNQRTSPVLSGSRVLFLGDSFAIGAFGRTFDQALRDAGFVVYTSVAGGGTPYYWLKQYPPVSIDIAYWERTPTSQRRLPGISAVPKIETLMARWKPDIVVVQTGTNLYASLRSKKRSKAANIREVESLVDKMCRAVTANGQRQLFWVTPPDSHVKRYPQALQDEMLSIMQRTAGRYGTVFNSTQVTSYNEPYPQSDGIHLAAPVSRKWGEKAARAFLSRFQIVR
jgi:hypothetical protein